MTTTELLLASIDEWRRDLRLLEDEQARLRAAVAAFPTARWTRKAPGKPFHFEGLVRGCS